MMTLRNPDLIVQRRRIFLIQDQRADGGAGGVGVGGGAAYGLLPRCSRRVAWGGHLVVLRGMVVVSVICGNR